MLQISITYDPNVYVSRNKVFSSIHFPPCFHLGFTLPSLLLLFHYFFAKPQSPHPYIENIGSIQPQLRDTQKIFADD
jgi:hypothetical protein